MAPISEERKRQNLEVAAFVKQLYLKGGFESWGEFAREIEVLPSMMSDWQRGENAPSGYNLLQIGRAHV